MARTSAMFCAPRKKESFEQARQRMVKDQLVRRGIADESVLRAMAEVPRERFVPPHPTLYAYDDTPLPIGGGQTISQPFMVAMMLEAAVIRPEDRVLEVGTGSGYVAALLGRMAATVYTIERDEDLFATAKLRLAGESHVHVRLGDGAGGLPDAAPFDAIVVAAAPEDVPLSLKIQMALGGRLLIPVGDRIMQRMIKVTRESEDGYREEDLGAVMFVPLR